MLISKPRKQKQMKSTRKKQNGRAQTVTNVPIPRNFLANNVSGIKQHCRQKLTYTFSASQSMSIAGTYYEPVVLYLNSPYYPAPAIGTASSNGFVKWMQFYSKCYATSARVRIVASNASPSFLGTTSSQPTTILVGTVVTTNATSLSSSSYAINQGLSQYRVIQYSPDTWTFDQSINISKFVDKPDILDDPQYFCTSSAGPTQIVCLHLFSQVLASSVSALSGSLVYTAEITYDCTFLDPLPFS
jgi:hypothetical protein